MKLSDASPRAMAPAKGFSLIEILTSILIFSIVLVAAADSLWIRTPRHHLDQAAREVRSRLSAARYRAVLENGKIRVVFGSDWCGLETFSRETGDWKAEVRCYLEGVTVNANNSPVFFPSGSVTNLATILISNPAGTYRITLAISGRIKTVRL